MDFSYCSLDAVPVRRGDASTAPETRTFQGIPGIERRPSGRLFAVYYAGGTGEGCDNYVQLSLSDDGGASWRHNVAVVDPPDPRVRAFDPVLWHAPDGGLRLFWAQSCSGPCGSKDVFDGLGGVWCSTLENPDDAPERFRFTPPRRVAHGVMMNKPTALNNGDWALPCSVWTGETYLKHESLHCVPGVAMVVSEDGGRHFAVRGRIDMSRVPGGTNCDEPMFLERRDGSVVCYLRIRTGIAESVSRDGGRTWSAPLPSRTIQAPSARFFIRRLSSGRLLLAINDSPTVREKLSVLLSEDDGASWPVKLPVDARPFTAYPDGVQAPDGTIWMIHDKSRTDGGEILLSRFTEEDVLAGKCVSPGSFLSRRIAYARPVPRSLVTP